LGIGGTIAAIIIGIIALIVIIAIIVFLIELLAPLFIGIIILAIIVGVGWWIYSKNKESLANASMPHTQHTQKRVGLESLFSSLVFHSVVPEIFYISKKGSYSELKEKEQKLFSIITCQ